MSITIKSNAKASANLKYAVRDNLLAIMADTSSNVDGVLLFSLDDTFCFKNQSTPISGDGLNNIADGAQNLTYFKAGNATGDAVWDASKKALDFSSVGVGVSGIRSSENWLSTEFNGNNKRFIMTAYVYIPTPENWHVKNAGLVDFAGTVTQDQPANQPEILGGLYFVHHPTDPLEYQIWAKFSSADKASGVTTTVSYAVDGTNTTFPFGKFAQISLVRDVTGNYLYIISEKGVIKVASTNTATTGKDVTTSGNKMCWGRGRAYAYSLVNNYKISRGFIVNLNKHNIADITSFLEADWGRQIARGWIA